jgi:hypothetical protein
MTLEVRMSALIRLSLLSVALCALLAPTASADGFGISFGKTTKHGAFGFGLSSAAPCAPGYGYRASCAPTRWVPAHYEIATRRVWVPGCRETVWIQPEYQWRRDAFGRWFRTCVSSGRHEVVQRPGYYKMRKVRVWVEGRFMAC